LTIFGISLTFGHAIIWLLSNYAADALRISNDAKMQIPVLGPAPSLLGRAAPGLLSSLFAPKAA